MSKVITVLVTLILVFIAAPFEVQVLDKIETKTGRQYHLVRTNRLTGEIKACVVSFADDDERPWAGCALASEDSE